MLAVDAGEVTWPAPQKPAPPPPAEKEKVEVSTGEGRPISRAVAQKPPNGN